MTAFVGCEPGQRYGFSTGSNNKEVMLDLAEAGAVKVSSHHTMLEDGALVRVWDRIPLEGDLLVLWHLDAAETFHGFYDPATFAGEPRPSWVGWNVRWRRQYYPGCPTITPKGRVVEASNMAVQAVAAVVEIPVEGLLYVTSGRYGSRWWMVHTVALAYSVTETLADYRARVLKGEGL